MSVEFSNARESLHGALTRAVDRIEGETITLRQLLELVGEHGLLFLCALLTIPFLIPVSIPGVSTVFGAASSRSRMKPSRKSSSTTRARPECATWSAR